MTTSYDKKMIAWRGNARNIAGVNPLFDRRTAISTSINKKRGVVTN
jgi:hypothetical protein